ncbi:MAG: right-handed parallel beta-helix repeat-containing protein [Chitinispirillaceae bacterium]|nr:right-handed parallel beta-helix repeat-containing protein [Chitinispirillaceae bacterium]
MYNKCTGFFCIGFLIISTPMVNAAGATYYVDSENGNDAANGSTESTAWKSLAKVNAATFDPGSRILFKAGGRWTGQLSPKGSGAGGSPIVIDRYGTGNKPLIEASGAASAVYLLNQSYWDINNLEVTNKAGDWGDYHGISVNGREFGTINHIYIKNCHIHDVHGVVAWIGSTDKNMTGVINSAGWDESKHSGGIVFDIQSPASKKTNFNDILIENNSINDCSFGGICIKQRQGSVGWGGRSSASDSRWFPHTNLIIRNNYLSQYNNDHGCNTMYITNVKGGLIENNVCAGSGVSAIELYYTDNIIVQKNETYGTIHRCNSADYNGIDADKGTTKTVFQYNYIHDCGDGFLFCQFNFGDLIVRYNILQNNSRHAFNLHSDAAATAQVYNNVLYTNKSSSTLVSSSGGTAYLGKGKYVIKNNIFYSKVSGPAVMDGATCSFDYNCYYGVTAVSEDAHKKTSDPKLVNPGNGGSGDTSGWAAGTLDGYKLQSGSPCINAGVSISDNGKTDFWGCALYNGNPDIGVHEFGSEPVTAVLKPDQRTIAINRHVPAAGSLLNGAIFGLDGRRAGFIRHGETPEDKSARFVRVIRYEGAPKNALIRLSLF